MVTSTIAGGDRNLIGPGARHATIGGGESNTIKSVEINPTFGATIAGGRGNVIAETAPHATIGGGEGNTIMSSQSQRTPGASIAGGSGNVIFPGAEYATIPGGFGNFIGIDANFSTIGGGRDNTIQPGADYAAIPGGNANQAAGLYSFAAGRRALVNHQGAFVWGDSTDADFGSTGANQFLIRASGGVGIGTANPVASLYVTSTKATAGDNTATFYNPTLGGFPSHIHYGLNGDWYIRSAQPAGNVVLQDTGGNVGIGTASPTSALHVASAGNTPQFQITQTTADNFTRLRMNVTGSLFWEMDVSSGATPSLSFWNNAGQRMTLDYNGNLTTSGTVNGVSDRNAKEKFKTVSAREVLDKVAALPISEWNFKNEPATRHIGPMAQDFHAAFNVGMDDKHIATVDADGVALAAIQGLNQKVEEKDARIAELERRLEKLEQLMNEKSGGGK